MDNTPEIVGNQVFFVEAATAKDIKDVVVRLEGCGNVVINIVPVYGGIQGTLQLLSGVFIFVAGDCKPVVPLPGTTNMGLG